jgi:FkbM family methyltransferase
VRRKILARVVQAFFDVMMSIPNKSGIHRIAFGFMNRCRKALVRVNDPCVLYNLGAARCRIPLSHDLPLFRKIYPLYSTNIARLAFQVNQKYPNLKGIDIGANVGDTVAAMRHAAHFPILCIEGDPQFFSLLKRNICQFENVFTTRAFVGNCRSVLSGTVERKGGTARIVQDSAGTDSIAIQTLSNILQNFPQFLTSKLIKVDTDGFDLSILLSELAFLKQAKPVVFFEYVPSLMASYNAEGRIFFAKLHNIGYQTALIYENTGTYLLGANLENDALLEDIHEYYARRMIHRYCDICIFHQEDLDLWRTIRRSEIDFLRKPSNDM